MQCGPIKYVNRQNEGQITVNDEIAIGSEHFYVISTNTTNTVLLSKYNLLVGDVYNKSGSNWSYTKSLSSSDSGYGLQSSSAKGEYSGGTDRTGIVAFSGKGYWNTAEYVCNGTSCNPTGSAGLKSEYANSANAAGNTGNYSQPYPYVYNSSMSTAAPTYTQGSPWGYAQNTGYTIAYYVERYVNILKSLGAPSNTTGRLLTYEEANSLSSTIKGNFSYWLGYAVSGTTGRGLYWDHFGDSNFWSVCSLGVRPVIEVPTNVIPN